MAQARIALAIAGCRGDGRRLAAGLRAARREQARRFPVPAAGHLPACARGRDRPHARAASQGVSNPTVQIVMPQDDLFQDEATPATAAIQLGNSADTLAPGAVRGMAQTAAASVKGLKSENVTITDSSGAILWPSDEAGGAAGGSAASRRPRRATPVRWRAAINAMLASTLGPNMAKVTVNADLNVDKSSDRGAHLRRRRRCRSPRPSESETMKGGGERQRGRHRRHRLQRPDLLRHERQRRRRLGQLREQEGHPQQRRQQEDHQDEKAPGAVNKINVALLVDKSVPADVANALKKTVATAAGLDTTRAATRSPRRSSPSPRPETPKAGPVPTTMLGPLKWVGLGLAALLFLFFMARGMKKRENENLTPALADRDRRAGLPGSARGGRRPAASRSTRLPRRCCPRVSRTPACTSSTS